MRFVFALFFISAVAAAQTTVSEVNPSLVKSGTTLASTTAGTSALETATDSALAELEQPIIEPTEKPKAATLNENQIPVQLESDKKNGTSENPWFKMIAGLLTFSIVAFGAVYFIRRYMRNSGEMKNAPQIKVLTQHYLGPKKHLAIVRVAGESILIGVTDTNISMLKSLSLLDEDIPETTPQDFSGVLDRTQQTDRTNFSTTTRTHNRAVSLNEEDFSITGIKDFVSSRLKNMKDLE